MSFTSYEFLVLLCAVLAVCWFLPHRWVNPFLLVASYVFYGWWDWRFLGLLLVSSLVDYVCGRLLDDKIPEHRRSDVLAVSVIVNLGVLLTYKYFDFFSRSFSDLMLAMGVEVDAPLVRLILPVGISFYTFQTLSYTIDVYRRKMKPTSRLIDFMLYVSFFPQLVAGPIERASHLLPQILSPRVASWSAISSGAQLTLVGFFKKMVIADNLAPVIEVVYRNPNANGLAVVLATYAFAFQIYCDFSGYTDIARGVSRMMGFDLCLNFRLPYFAISPSDFWQRWHISLSSWFRDYLYIPLGGNRGGGFATLRNLVITMFLAGLWHGASWHFVIWGLYHGVLLVIFHAFGQTNLFRAFQKSSPQESDSAIDSGWRFWTKAALFFQLTCIGWFIFRVNKLEDLLAQGSNVIRFWAWDYAAVDSNLPYRLLVLCVPLLLFQIYQHVRDRLEPWQSWPVLVRVLFYVTLFYSIVLFGAPERHEFIYFQF